jgi:hypothetical protein
MVANALNQADELVKGKGGITPEMIAAQLLNGIEYVQRVVLPRQAAGAAEVSEKSIRELQLLENQYESLNKTLIKLTTPPSKRDQMEQIATFIKGVAENYKRLEQEAAADSAPK